jgi:hypothetical protein
MLNPNVINVDDSELVTAKQKFDSLVNEYNDLLNKINIKRGHISHLSDGHVAIPRIVKDIEKFETSLWNLFLDYGIYHSDYVKALNYYTENEMSLRNFAIVKGIRNSIAHGHYEFISNGDFDDTFICFKDIYNGKITFELKVSFKEFEEMISQNMGIVMDFVKDNNDNSLVKKKIVK